MDCNKFIFYYAVFVKCIWLIYYLTLLTNHNNNKNIIFVAPNGNNGEEHWNNAVCNSWTTDMTALQYFESDLVTTIYPGSAGVTKQNSKIKQIAETVLVSAIFCNVPIR